MKELDTHGRAGLQATRSGMLGMDGFQAFNACYDGLGVGRITEKLNRSFLSNVDLLY